MSQEKNIAQKGIDKVKHIFGAETSAGKAALQASKVTLKAEKACDQMKTTEQDAAARAAAMAERAAEAKAVQEEAAAAKAIAEGAAEAAVKAAEAAEKVKLMEKKATHKLKSIANGKL
ncbi:hypothetical protein FOA52_015583 [Chlamydomonas sp. UWO 241]|nr:hypothetical protein FOA52_015583 [Chlamydomonas sp. UWO 241]